VWFVSWWVLFLLWLLLLLLVLALVALVGRRTYRQFRALLREIDQASQSLTAAAEGRGDVDGSSPERLPSATGRTP
jgi:hypothetical protein